MKEKRYYCDWALNSCNKKSYHVIKKVVLVSFVLVTAVSSLIYYNIIMNNHGENLEAYSESDYEYLDEIANNVIGKDEINVAAIPEDVEILNKEPNFSSKEEYAKSHKIGFYIFVPIFGALTWGVMAVVSCIVMIVAIPISMIHKKKDMKNNLS